MFWNRKEEKYLGNLITFTPILPLSKKEFLTMKEMLLDAEKYDCKGEYLPCTRILESLSEYIENYINKSNKD